MKTPNRKQFKVFKDWNWELGDWELDCNSVADKWNQLNRWPQKQAWKHHLPKSPEPCFLPSPSPLPLLWGLSNPKKPNSRHNLKLMGLAWHHRNCRLHFQHWGFDEIVEASWARLFSYTLQFRTATLGCCRSDRRWKYLAANCHCEVLHGLPLE